jgi:hypothetical protein
MLTSPQAPMVVVWCVVVWCGVVWCGVVWCGVVWCGVGWCGGVWGGVVWCGVVWCVAVCVCVVVQESWGADLRNVTVLFVNLGLKDHDLLAAAAYDDAMKRAHDVLLAVQVRARVCGGRTRAPRDGRGVVPCRRCVRWPSISTKAPSTSS